MYEHQFLKALGVTLTIETLALFLIVRHIFSVPRAGPPNELLVFAGIVSSGLTLPYLWFILPFFIKSHAVYVIVGESSAVLIETVIYSLILKFNLKRSFILSLVANLCSYQVGRMIL